MKYIVDAALAGSYIAGLCFLLVTLECGVLLLDKLVGKRRRAKKNTPRTLTCSEAQVTNASKIIA